jgi:hypothetical protein
MKLFIRTPNTIYDSVLKFFQLPPLKKIGSCRISVCQHISQHALTCYDPVLLSLAFPKCFLPLIFIVQTC